MTLLECGNPKFMGRAHFPRANFNLWGCDWFDRAVESSEIPLRRLDVQKPSIRMNKIALGKAFAYTIQSKCNTTWLSIIDNHTDSQCMRKHRTRMNKVSAFADSSFVFICRILYMHSWFHSHCLSPSLNIHTYIGNTLRPKSCQHIHTLVRQPRARFGKPAQIATACVYGGAPKAQQVRQWSWLHWSIFLCISFWEVES